MKLFSRLLAVAFAVALLAPSAHAASIDLELAGLVPAMGGTVYDYGYGSKGLYLGDDWSSMNHMYTNFTWDTVGMEIQMNGDASITGSMTRGDGSVWGLDIQLTGIQFVGSALSGVTSVYDDIIWDLVAAGENGAGLEWSGLTMSLTAPYATSVPLTGWMGFAMPTMGHINVAELHYKDGNVIFDAWYKNPANDDCGYMAYCYNVGDSKAKVVEKPIPEPTAALVFATGLLLTGGAVRRRR